MYTSRRELGLQRKGFHMENPVTIFYKVKNANWLNGNPDKKATFSILGDMNMCLKYWEQDLGQALNVNKDRCLFIYFYICLWQYGSHQRDIKPLL